MQGTAVKEQGAGAGVNREQRTANSGVVVVLPVVWAVGEKRPCGSVGVVAGKQEANTGVSPLRAFSAPVEMTDSPRGGIGGGGRKAGPSPMAQDDKRRAGSVADDVAMLPNGAASVAEPVEVAFYRKYTEALLRRYAVMSMEAGRVPSMLGREMFRGKVTNYRVQGFDDSVIFCHDVESCLKRLPALDQRLLKRVAVQQYTHGEAAPMLGISLRSCVRHYAEAVDRLTKILISARVMEPQKALVNRLKTEVHA